MDDRNYFKTLKNFIPDSTDRTYFLIIIINTVFGLQILSSFLSLLVNYLRERPTVSLIQVAIYALVTFLLVFLAGLLFKKLSKHALFLTLMIAVAVLRFIIQVCRVASLSLAVSALGTVFWIISIVFFISLAQQRKIKLFFTVFPAILFGFAIYTCINGLLGTWDMIWRPEPLIIFILFAFVIFKIRLALTASFDLERQKSYSDGSRAVFYSLVIVMPFIFLQLYQFQNVAAFDAKTGFAPVLSSTIILASNVAALAFSYLISIKRLRIPITIISAILVVLSFWPELTGTLYILQVVIGNLASWWLLLAVLNRAVSYSKE
jgi:MFS family permease